MAKWRTHLLNGYDLLFLFCSQKSSQDQSPDPRPTTPSGTSSTTPAGDSSTSWSPVDTSMIYEGALDQSKGSPSTCHLSLYGITVTLALAFCRMWRLFWPNFVSRVNQDDVGPPWLKPLSRSGPCDLFTSERRRIESELRKKLTPKSSLPGIYRTTLHGRILILGEEHVGKKVGCCWSSSKMGMFNL